MARFFNFYDPLEKRYVFNSFLVVVALVEILILVFTLIWQIDFEGIFADAGPDPDALSLEAISAGQLHRPHCPAVPVRPHHPGLRSSLSGTSGDLPGPGWAPGCGGVRYLLGLLVFMAVLVFLVQGKAAFALITSGIKAIGLGGSYLLIALLALGLLYLWVRLILRYRLQKKAMEYQYLLTLAERHGVIVVDPKAHPELAAGLDESREKNYLPDAAASPANLPIRPQIPSRNKSDL